MDRFTDEQIVQGLECLNDKHDRVCGKCPFYQKEQTCRHIVLDAATTRFKELTETLEKERTWSFSMIDNLRDDVRELTEANASLQETCDRYDLIVRSAAKVSETTRAEVIDEFAELAKKVLSRDTHKAIDQIAKEMSEAKEQGYEEQNDVD